MKLKSKLIAGMLLTALLPLTISMGLSLWGNVKNMQQLTIDAVNYELQSIGAQLSTYFTQRISIVEAYARAPVIRSMAYEKVSPFIKQEINHHSGYFEKFIVGRTDGQYYYSAGGNPYLGGVASFDDARENSRAKSISMRDYWVYTVGDNKTLKERSYVSNPMISYTTGAKQVVVAASVFDESGKLAGMFGGALPWYKIEQHIDGLRSELENRLPWDAKLFLISPEGIYWYHWDPQKVVHIKKDANGNTVINRLGEKVSVRSKITTEDNIQLAAIGHLMMNGDSGYELLTDKHTDEKQAIFFQSVKGTGYAVGLQIPYNQINAPITSLIQKHIAVTLGAIFLVIIVAPVLSRKIARPITSLRDAADEVSRGRWDYPLPSGGDDEVGDLTLAFGSMIASIKEREQSLAVSEERFALAMKGSSDGLWDWSMQTDNVYYSPRWKKMLGYEEDDLADKLTTFESLVQADDLVQVKQKIDAYLNGRIENFRAELRMRHKDGHYVDVLSRGFAVRDADSAAVRFVGTHADISERKKAEAALVTAKDVAEQANLAKDQFLSNMSHELRTPLNAIIGFAGILESDEPQHLTESERRSLSEITTAGWHLLDLINDILDLSNIEVGKLHIELVPVKLGKVLDECNSVLSPSAKNRDISIAINKNCENVYLSADKLRLKQVLLNLISNAIKYNHAGGRVNIDCLQDESNSLKISVSDTGVGISTDNLNEIFEPFSRLDSHHQCIEGAGVGLTLSRHLMHLMGGDIGVESREGSGSTFWITIPVIDVPINNVPEQKPVESLEILQKNSANYSILCVEDNPANLDLIREILSRVADYRVLAATSGEEGVEMALQHQPDLILMDINMPGMNGIEAMKKIRGTHIISRIPILGLSANALQVDIDDAMSKGFDDYITKPFVLRELLATIKHWLEDKE